MGSSKAYLNDLVSLYNVEDCCELLDNQPREEALKTQQESNILLLIKTQVEGCFPAKIFEYIGAAKPVLSIGPEDKYINELFKDVGNLYSYQDEEEIAKQIKIWLDEFSVKHEIAIVDNLEARKTFSRRHQAQLFDKKLNELIS